MNSDAVEAIIHGDHQRPHEILGIHAYNDYYYINVFWPFAWEVYIEDRTNGRKLKMDKIHFAGFYTLKVEEKLDYRYYMKNLEGHTWYLEDPYRYGGQLSDVDLYLFGQGTHYEIYNKLGAHPTTTDGVEGVAFAVWAPNAKRVSVVGDFNHWDGRVYPMEAIGDSGAYELFIPAITEGDIYKYEIKAKSGVCKMKADPYGFYGEMRPNTASRVADLDGYIWRDDSWLEARREAKPLNSPVSIYEVHLGSWKRQEDGSFMNYRDLAHELVNYVQDMGYTHIELLPIAEHPYDASWGYQVVGYYAVTSRYGTPTDFMYFVDYCHQHGIGVILDWVPAHFPRDEHGLYHFDGTALYEHEDPRRGEHPHWGTMIFNYGRHEVCNFLIANALFWLEKYHIDGLRVDAVASMLYLDYGKEDGNWLPNHQGGHENLEAVQFLKHMNSVVYERHPHIMMIAEESTSWEGVSRPAYTGGLGFLFKWNMGWMNDFLRYMKRDPIHRPYHHVDLTFSMVYAYTENFILVLSHDEVVHEKGSMIRKMPGDYWQQFANLRATYGLMFTHPGKKLLFMGNDIAQFDEWDEGNGLHWHLLDYESHREMQDYVRALNHVYRQEEAMWYDDFTEHGFQWINCCDADASMISFLRRGSTCEETLVVVCNFTPVPRIEHRIGVPYSGSYLEIFNSDASKFGGSGIVNKGLLEAIDIEWDGRQQAIDLDVPPLGVTILKYLGTGNRAQEEREKTDEE